MEKPITFEGLKKNFESKYQSCQDKAALLDREIEGYAYIFDKTKFSFPIGFHPFGKFPGGIININDYYAKCSILKQSAVGHFSLSNVFIIRSAYYHFILDVHDKAEAGDWLRSLVPNSQLSPDELYTKGIYYINLANDTYEYQKWLQENYLSSKTKKEDSFGKVTSKPKYSLRQIALIYIYENKVIDKRNADEIAKNYGWNSGDKLYSHYRKYLVRSNIIMSEGERKDKFKLKELEIIRASLSKQAREILIKDITALELNIL